jgi:uncharacterized protein YbaR (Trm112 family)
MHPGFPPIFNDRGEDRAAVWFGLSHRLGTVDRLFSLLDLGLDDRLFDRSGDLLVNDASAWVGVVARLCTRIDSKHRKSGCHDREGRYTIDNPRKDPMIHGNPSPWIRTIGCKMIAQELRFSLARGSLAVLRAPEVSPRVSVPGNSSAERKSMIDSKLVEMLRCPIDGNRLELAEKTLLEQVNDAIGRGELRDRMDQKVLVPVDDLLVNLGEKRGYPIRGGIPSLVADQSFELPG